MSEEKRKTLEEYTKMVGLLLTHVNELREHSFEAGSFNTAVELEDLEMAVEKAELTDRQAEVVRMYYYEDRWLSEIGEEKGTSKQNESLHLNAALKKIAKIYKQWEEYE